jgi:LuxR family maltose regulon positive regulatory protein
VDGWTELEHARWPEARAAFEAALAEQETAAAHEGLSWAAWWLDDGPTVFAARERAHSLYGDAGDARGAARMALWLAVDELDFRGSWAVAGGWLRRAERLLEGVEPCSEQGWLAFHAGYMAYGSGDTPRAAELARTASDLGRRLGVPDLEMLGLALQGATLVACAQVEEGMRRLDEATVTALQGGAENPMSGAWTFCFLVSACTAVLDYARAAQWCDRIAEFAERYGSRMMLAFCRAEYGAVHLWRGRWTDAEAMLEAAIEDFLRSRPGMVGGARAGLAELRRRQGRAADAARLCEQAEGSSSSRLCLARMALDRGAPREAAELVERLLRNMPEHRRLSRAPALELLVQARAAARDLDGAEAALTALRDVAAEVGTAPLRASADVAEARVLAARGEHDRARVLLEDAVDCFTRDGAPFEAAQARLALAASLGALGRPEAAEREAAAAHERLRELGASTTPPLPELTPREREVLALLAEGLTNRGIAERLVVSEHTVHRHVTSILRKLDLPTRAAAAAVAARSGM